jgi:hypothetical protein
MSDQNSFNQDSLNQNSRDQTRTDIFLDGGEEPIITHRSPVRFQLDTTALDDGPHTLRIEAYDAGGQKGVRHLAFEVRNGPGIAINGLSDNDVLEGKIQILVNSYGGASETRWEPSRAETPAPTPTWIWVLLIVIMTFGIFYGLQQWYPPPPFADTPTYGAPEARSTSPDASSE